MQSKVLVGGGVTGLCPLRKRFGELRMPQRFRLRVCVLNCVGLSGMHPDVEVPNKRGGLAGVGGR